MSSAALEKYRAEILNLAIRQGARDVRVFGSFANRPVDVVTEKALSPYLRERVLSEAIPL